MGPRAPRPSSCCQNQSLTPAPAHSPSTSPHLLSHHALQGPPLPAVFTFLGNSHQLLLSQRFLTKGSCPERPFEWTAFSRNGRNNTHSSVP